MGNTHTFWNTAAETTGGTLTVESYMTMLDELVSREEEARRQPWRCPHKQMVVPPSFARKLDGKPCPFGCGVLLAGPGATVTP